MSLAVEAFECCLTWPGTSQCRTPLIYMPPPTPTGSYTPRHPPHRPQSAQPVRTHARDAPLAGAMQNCCGHVAHCRPLCIYYGSRHHNPSLHTHSPEKQQRRPPGTLNPCCRCMLLPPTEPHQPAAACTTQPCRRCCCYSSHTCSHQLGYMVPSGGCGRRLLLGEAIARLSSTRTVSMV